MKDKGAYLIKANGEAFPVAPANGTDFGLDELYRMITCELIEIVRISKDAIMVVDEEGRIRMKDFNETASDIAGRIIVGDVVVCPDEYVK